ncbi:MAG: hypothetical protein JXA92_03570 [candidate division Zixibacteria bacterium]|nr:hypothetical protein [candidate division Zixibacteria bacterium]
MAQMTSVDINALKEQGVKEGWTFSIGENSATACARENLSGLTVPDDWSSTACFVTFPDKLDLPVTFDWRELNGCTSIKDQGGCGSCWAFATLGVLESNIKIIDGWSVNLSEQWLLSCNRSGYNCTGGWFAHDYLLWQTDSCGETGAVLEYDFPYAAYRLPCGCPHEHHYFIDDWAYIGGSSSVPSVDAMKQAIMNYGPISVAVRTSPAMYAYNGGIFNYNDPNEVDHGVILVGWDDNQGTAGVWFMRNSWGEDWGEDGYMRIEYGCSSIGFGACFIEYSGIRALAFSCPNGVVETVYPEESTLVEMTVAGRFAGVPVPGSGLVHWSVNGGDYSVQPMMEIEDNRYRANLPPLGCDSNLNVYFSAEEADTVRYYFPDTVQVIVPRTASDVYTVFEDDFEDEKGWSVSGTMTSGQWMRGAPAVGDNPLSPDSDFDGSGQCFVTGLTPGIDVDSGVAVLISPTFNLDGLEARITYARWFTGEFDGLPGDFMRVYISNDDGGSWYPVEELGPGDYRSYGGWYEFSFYPDDIVVPSEFMKLRFEVSDLGENSLVEAALDAVRVRYFDCVIFTCGDVNNDQIGPDISDITYLIKYLYLHGSEPSIMKASDVNASGGEPDISDIAALIAHLYIDHRELTCPR